MYLISMNELERYDVRAQVERYLALLMDHLVLLRARDYRKLLRIFRRCE